MELQRRSVLTGLVAASVCPICLARGALAAGSGPHWSYDGADGPEHWGELSPDFKACALGTQQSPINLARPVPAGLTPLTLHWRRFPLTVVNNGHTIEVPIPDGAPTAEAEAEAEDFEDIAQAIAPTPGYGTATEGGEVFLLKQFHFHHPSEHRLNGKDLAMEAHFVHMNQARTAALVVGVFIVAGDENPALKVIWDNMPKTAGVSETKLSINPTRLLPENRDRFRYEGSLTTPPCS